MDFAGKVNAMLGRLDDSVAGYGRCVWVCVPSPASNNLLDGRETDACPTNVGYALVVL